MCVGVYWIYKDMIQWKDIPDYGIPWAHYWLEELIKDKNSSVARNLR